MKLLFFMPTLNGGGAEKALSDIIKLLDKSKYEITLKTIFNEGVYFDSLKSLCEIEYCFNTKNKIFYYLYHTFINYSHYLPRKLIWKLLINKNYDIEIAFMEGVCTRIISGSSNHKSKKVAWVHTDLRSNAESFKQFFSNNENLTVYKSFNKIIAVSNQARKSISEIFKLDAEVIYNLIDKENILLKSKEPIQIFEQSEEPVVVAIGRLEYIKGFDRLLNAHLRLINENIKHKLMIIGEGSLKNKLDDFIIFNNLSKTVRLLDFQANPYKFILNSDLLVSSSISEGFGLVILEALILQIPILATETAGALELLDKENIVKNDEESLYKGLKKVLSDPIKLKALKEYSITFSKQYCNNEILIKLDKIFE